MGRADRELERNRRIRKRTYGGVRGRESRGSLLLDSNKLAYLKETKNGRPRSISLSDAVIAELQKLYNNRNPLKPLVFASKTAFGGIDIKKAWHTALRLSGIENCRAHDMRHSFATMAAAQGASNIELATAMGHRTLEILQKYTHLDVRVTKKFSNQISAAIVKELEIQHINKE